LSLSFFIFQHPSPPSPLLLLYPVSTADPRAEAVQARCAETLGTYAKRVLEEDTESRHLRKKKKKKKLKKKEKK
jgi:hypothetical protein